MVKDSVMSREDPIGCTIPVCGQKLLWRQLASRGGCAGLTTGDAAALSSGSRMIAIPCTTPQLPSTTSLQAGRRQREIGLIAVFHYPEPVFSQRCTVKEPKAVVTCCTKGSMP